MVQQDTIENSNTTVETVPKETVDHTQISELFGALLEKYGFEPTEKLMPFIGTLMIQQKSVEIGSKAFLEIEFMRYNILIRLIKMSNSKVEPSEVKELVDKMMDALEQLLEFY
tara:strand:- start:1357 stop:1695 length:339 start_codon:yes stop_codon:yes gene_type:complete